MVIIDADSVFGLLHVSEINTASIFRVELYRLVDFCVHAALWPHSLLVLAQEKHQSPLCSPLPPILSENNAVHALKPTNLHTSTLKLEAAYSSKISSASSTFT
jgi:hypothetical protein